MIVLLCYVMLCYVMLSYIILCYVSYIIFHGGKSSQSYRFASCVAACPLRRVVSCRVVSCRVVSCRVVSCCVVSSRVVA